MSFLDRIEKLQKKPRGVREKILAASVIIIMAVLIAVWIQMTRRNFLQKPPLANSESPFKTLWNIAGRGFKDVLDQFKNGRISQ